VACRSTLSPPEKQEAPTLLLSLSLSVVVAVIGTGAGTGVGVGVGVGIGIGVHSARVVLLLGVTASILSTSATIYMARGGMQIDAMTTWEVKSADVVRRLLVWFGWLMVVKQIARCFSSTNFRVFVELKDW
jgi:hypothetical protein